MESFEIMEALTSTDTEIAQIVHKISRRVIRNLREDVVPGSLHVPPVSPARHLAFPNEIEAHDVDHAP